MTIMLNSPKLIQKKKNFDENAFLSMMDRLFYKK